MDLSDRWCIPSMHACVPMSSVGDNAMTLRVSGPVLEYSFSCYVNDNLSEHTGLNIWRLSLSDMQGLCFKGRTDKSLEFNYSVRFYSHFNVNLQMVRVLLNIQCHAYWCILAINCWFSMLWPAFIYFSDFINEIFITS